jgi:hypothetical protein
VRHPDVPLGVDIPTLLDALCAGRPCRTWCTGRLREPGRTVHFHLLHRSAETDPAGCGSSRPTRDAAID